MQFPAGRDRVSQWVACNLFFWSGGKYGTYLYVHLPVKFRITVRRWRPSPPPSVARQVVNETARK